MTRRFEIIRSLIEEPEIPEISDCYSWQAGDDLALQRVAEITHRVFKDSPNAEVWPMVKSEGEVLAWMRANEKRLNSEATGVVMKGDTVVGGVICFQEWPKVGEILSIGIDASERGANLGVYLLRTAETMLRKSGCEFSKGVVDASADRLVAFYERNGYALLCERWIEPPRPTGARRILGKLKRLFSGG